VVVLVEVAEVVALVAEFGVYQLFGDGEAFGVVLVVSQLGEGALGVRAPLKTLRGLSVTAKVTIKAPRRRTGRSQFKEWQRRVWLSLKRPSGGLWRHDLSPVFILT